MPSGGRQPRLPAPPRCRSGRCLQIGQGPSPVAKRDRRLPATGLIFPEKTHSLGESPASDTTRDTRRAVKTGIRLWSRGPSRPISPRANHDQERKNDRNPPLAAPRRRCHGARSRIRRQPPEPRRFTHAGPQPAQPLPLHARRVRGDDAARWCRPARRAAPDLRRGPVGRGRRGLR
jgi:hypothetical protein